MLTVSIIMIYLAGAAVACRLLLPLPTGYDARDTAVLAVASLLSWITVALMLIAALVMALRDNRHDDSGL